MKICVINNIIAPYRVPVFNELAKIGGVDLEVLFLAESEPWRRWKVCRDGMRFKYKVLKSFCARTRHYPVFITPSIGREISASGPSIVFCGSYESPAAWLALSACRKNRIPFVGWVEATAGSQRPSTFARDAVKKWFLSRCDAFLAHGKASKEFLEKAFGADPGRIFISPHTVDNTYYRERSVFLADRAKEFKAQKGYPEKLLLYVGSFERRKAVMDLLKAFLLIKDRKETGILMVGAGDDACQRECARFCAANGIGGKTFFEGFVQVEDIPLYYRMSDVLVFPTHRDTWGLVINEAMACGLPVISSDAAGATDDLVANGRNGFTYPSGDIGRLAACIDKILGDDGLRSAMGKESLDIISAFTPKKSAEGFVAAARAVLEGDAG